ncbi:MAG: VWA domain-containing protein [Terriglobia bacterium]
MRNGSFKSWHFRLLILGGVALLSVVMLASPPQQVQEPPLPAATPAAQASEPEYKLRVEKNVVVVRVVVRDSKGHAVGGLKKEDFTITDNKKPQTISSFAVETSVAATAPAQPSAAAPAAKAGQEAAAAPSAPVSYLAFYFDDLYSAQDSLYRAGQAAEQFIAGLPPTERVAIFTSSGIQSLDFTDDRQKLHEALMKLRANSRVNPKGRCPEINDYLAYRAHEYGDKDEAWAIIADEALNDCHWPPLMAGNKELLRPLVLQVYEAHRFQSRAVLKNLESVIERIAAMPGERQVMLVSDGFMDLEMNNRVESVVDHALRARVTISALVGAGLTVNMVEMDTTRSNMPPPELSTVIHTYNTAREVAATGTLAEVAQGTGGQFVGETNDLLGGMRKVLLPPEVMYVLTFSPENLKQDGAFHTLKVTLTNSRGLSIQARRGYFAPKGQAALEELAKNEIREAVYSSYALQDLPLTFETEVRKAEGQSAEIAVQAQLDVRNLPFQKQGDLNLDNVVFAVGLFDHDGKYVTGSQQTYALSLKDTTLAEMEKRGLSLKTHVSAKTGAYTLRVVVRDSQGGKMAASSKAVEVPSQTAPPAAQQVVPSGPGVVSDTQAGKTAASNKAVAVPSQIAPPAAERVVPSGPAVGQSGEMAASSKAVEAPSQTAPPLAAQLVASADKPFFEAYRRSDPITKWQLKKTLHQIPELKGLKPATDQSQLPEILRRVSANLQKFVVNFVDTAALEIVDEGEESAMRNDYSVPGNRMMTNSTKQKFRYLMLARREGSAFSLVEYRTDLHGREEHPQIQTGGFIKTTGFAAMPLFFGPLQQPWSDFRYLGQQTIGGTGTDVVAFAERIDPAAVMGHFVVGEMSVPLLVQGVAWIRAADYQILQMRTDLLAPLPPLAQVTTLVLYANTEFQGSPTALWLPREVEVKVGLGSYLFSNRHRYSDYRLFQVKSVIRTDFPAAQQH